MRTVFVKLLNNFNLLGLPKDPEPKAHISPFDKACVFIEAGNILNLKDGSPVVDKVVMANQTVLIEPAYEVSPSNYRTLVSWNPQLPRLGAVVSPLTPVVRPGHKDVGLIVRASKKLDLSELDHIFELYQID